MLQRGRHGLRPVLAGGAFPSVRPGPWGPCCLCARARRALLPCPLRPALGCPATPREPTMLLSCAGAAWSPPPLGPLFLAPRACVLQHTSSAQVPVVTDLCRSRAPECHLQPCVPGLCWPYHVPGVARGWYSLLMTAVARMDAMPACWGRSWMSVCEGVRLSGSVGSFFTGCLGVLWGSVTRSTLSSPPAGTGFVSLHQRAPSAGVRAPVMGGPAALGPPQLLCKECPHILLNPQVRDQGFEAWGGG